MVDVYRAAWGLAERWQKTSSQNAMVALGEKVYVDADRSLHDPGEHVPARLAAAIGALGEAFRRDDELAWDVGTRLAERRDKIVGKVEAAAFAVLIDALGEEPDDEPGADTDTDTDTEPEPEPETEPQWSSETPTASGWYWTYTPHGGPFAGYWHFPVANSHSVNGYRWLRLPEPPHASA